MNRNNITIGVKNSVLSNILQLSYYMEELKDFDNFFNGYAYHSKEEIFNFMDNLKYILIVEYDRLSGINLYEEALKCLF